MSSQSSPPEAALSGSPSRLPKVAFVAAAAGALLSTRSRFSGALVLGGLVWMASRRKEASPAPAAVVVTTSLEDLCAPSDPFLESPAEEFLSGEKTPSWEDLRSTLQPPASLFTPAPPPPAQTPSGPLADSPLLHAAPVFIEVPEDILPTTANQATLPDTIAIPTTPDPPPDLLAGVQPPVRIQPLVPSPLPAVHPKAGLHIPTAHFPLILPPLEPSDLPSAQPRRKSFFQWLRDP